MSLLDDVFEILEAATRQEKAGNRVEAATKYYEATYLMRRVLEVTPQEANDTRRLLENKIREYSMAASKLYFDDSTMPLMTTRGESVISPVSTLTQQSFFQEEVALHNPNKTPCPESRRLTQSAEVNQITSQANAKLTRAIELDEAGSYSQAIQNYMSSAELYLQAIRMCKDGSASSSIVPVLKRRLGGALVRVEQLKLHKNSHRLKQV